MHVFSFIPIIPPPPSHMPHMNHLNNLGPCRQSMIKSAPCFWRKDFPPYFLGPPSPRPPVATCQIIMDNFEPLPFNDLHKVWLKCSDLF